MEIKFVVDNNVGKLAKWLRIMGYDALLFREKDDGEMIKIALSDNRVVLTKDTQIMQRRLITSGRLKAILIEDDDSKAQLRQVADALGLDYQLRPFSVCLECNESLVERDKDEVRDLVPPYVFKTQSQYMECPSCHRIYWQGTHWQAMSRELERMGR
ncbi:MAG: Mut7-C RNAse domain-containing protein [Dehalococcoidia bacterium]|nr:Mut7-C RNAse domain-containing protein [Dehalococcoidia bacterium]